MARRFEYALLLYADIVKCIRSTNVSGASGNGMQQHGDATTDFAMEPIVVSISDMKLSTRPEDVIVTYSLGSCLGVTAYDPKARIGGMVHCLLPSAKGAREKARLRPYMFVNTGVAMMVRKLKEKGADKRRLIFKAAGCANMRGDEIFQTGKRNFAALEKLLERNHVTLAAQSVGGTIPRTLFLYLDTGRVVVRSLGKEADL